MKRVLLLTIHQKEMATKIKVIKQDRKKAEERGKGVKGSRSNSKKMLRRNS